MPSLISTTKNRTDAPCTLVAWYRVFDRYTESGYPARATSRLRGTISDSLLALQLSDEGVHVHLEHLGDFEELDEVETALAGLVLGDE
jgi:hypothetical protein